MSTTSAIPDHLKDAMRGAVKRLGDMVDFRRRMDGYRLVFEKINRILTGRSINVAVVDPPYAHLAETPGWTDGDTVFLNGMILERDLKGLQGKDIRPLVLSLKGLNYHELAHILYSPRIQDDISKKVIEQQARTGDALWWNAFNILEDQRAETWFTTTYAPAVRYFESVSTRWLVSNQNQLAESFVLVHGRKFLNPRIRRKVRNAFVAKYGETLATSFADVIDQYLLMAFPSDTIKGFKLVKQFRDLLHLLNQAQPPGAGCVLVPINGGHKGTPHHRGGRDAPDDILHKGRPQHKDQKKARDAAKEVVARAKVEDEREAKQEAKEAQEKAEAQEQAAAEAEAARESQDGPEGQPGAQGQGDAEKAGDGPTGADGSDTGETGDQEGEGDGEGASGESQGADDGAGAGQGVGTGEGPMDEPKVDTSDSDPFQDAMDAIYDALDDALDDPKLQQDLDDTIRALKAAADQAGNAEGEYAKFHEQDVPGEGKRIASRIEHVLRKLSYDLEPTWLKREMSGRLSPRRVATAQPHELDIFDRWDEGSEEEGGVEVVVLLDQSASMSSIIDQASASLWTLKRAFDELDIRTTVIGYSSGHQILMRPTDKAKPNIYRRFGTYGNTVPNTALREALNILARSREPNRVLIAITDGQWHDREDQPDVEVRSLLRALRKQARATTMILGLNRAVSVYGRHGFELGKDMQEMRELPDIALDLVTSIMRKVSNRA